MLKCARIALLKRQARNAYGRMQTPHLDCGAHLADHITGGKVSRARADFDAAMAELRRIDPSAPGYTGRMPDKEKDAP